MPNDDNAGETLDDDEWICSCGDPMGPGMHTTPPLVCDPNMVISPEILASIQHNWEHPEDLTKFRRRRRSISELVDPIMADPERRTRVEAEGND